MDLVGVLLAHIPLPQLCANHKEVTNLILYDYTGWLMVAGVVGWIPIGWVVQWLRFGGWEVSFISKFRLSM